MCQFWIQIRLQVLSVTFNQFFCCETQVVVGNFSKTELGKEAKLLAEVIIRCNSLRKCGNQ